MGDEKKKGLSLGALLPGRKKADKDAEGQGDENPSPETEPTTAAREAADLEPSTGDHGVSMSDVIVIENRERDVKDLGTFEGTSIMLGSCDDISIIGTQDHRGNDILSPVLRVPRKAWNAARKNRVVKALLESGSITEGSAAYA